MPDNPQYTADELMKINRQNTLGMLGAGAAGQIVGFGLNALGMGMQRKQAQKLQDMQIKGQKEMLDYSKTKDLEMWKATSYPGQMEQMKLAGLNPGLMYGMGGGGGVTTGGTGPGISGQSAQMPHLGNPMDIAQLAMMAAQKANIEADTNLKNVEAGKKGGVDTEEAQTRIAINKAEEVIRKYTGMEAGDMYNLIKSPNRSIEAKTYQDELEARQGVAGTIYELWIEGKLKEKGLEEIESIVLGNAKSRAEKSRIITEIDMLEKNMKGKDIQNMLDEIDLNVLKNIGLGKDSPKYIQMLSAIFMKLLGK